MALRLILTGEGFGGQRQARLLSQGSLSLGRGPGNDWVLPDPDRHLSKTHCVVAVERGQYVLTDLSTNGVYVNGASQPTSRDDRILLTDGDDFRLGTYTVQVEEVDDAAAHARGGAPLHPGGAFGTDPFADEAAGGRGAAEGGSPLDVDPLDDPLGRAPDPAFRHPVAHHAASPRGHDPFDHQDEQRRQHRAYEDPHGGLGSGQGAGLGPGLGADPEEDLFRGVAPSPLWQGAAQPDHADAPAHAFTPPRVIQPGPAAPAPAPPGGIDFDELIGDLSPAAGVGPAVRGTGSPQPPQAFSPAQPPPAPPQAAPSAYSPAADPFGAEDDLLAPASPAAAPARPAVAPAPAAPPPLPGAPPPLPGAPPPLPATAGMAPSAPTTPPVPTPPLPASLEQPVQPAAPPAVSYPPPQPAPAQAKPPITAVQAASQPAQGQAGAGQAGGAQAGLAAFLEGAGLDRVQAPPGDPDAVLRAAGQVFRAMTEGLREVLMSRAAIKGEMRVEQTMIRARDNNALKFSVTADDAVAALLGGSRPGYMPPLRAAQEAFGDVKSHELAVMAGVQEALVALLHRFDPEALEKRLAGGLLDSVLPAARKARLWDGFKQVYGDIAREAEDDFQAVFGREFARAYAAQTSARSKKE